MPPSSRIISIFVNDELLKYSADQLSISEIGKNLFLTLKSEVCNMPRHRDFINSEFYGLPGLQKCDDYS